MRTLILIILLFCVNGFAQDATGNSGNAGQNTTVNSGTANNQANNANEPNLDKLNKYQINELLEEARKKIGELETDLKKGKEYEEFLDGFNSRISGITNTSAEELINEIKNADKSGLEDKIEVLFNKLNRFNSNSGEYNDDVNKKQAKFELKVNDLLQDLRYSKLAKLTDLLYNGTNSKSLDSKDLDEILKQIKSFISDVNSLLQTEMKNNKNSSDKIEKDLGDQIKWKSKLSEALSKETQINGLSIKLGLPLFCGTILLLFLGPKLIECRRRRRNIEQDEDDEASSKRVLVEICTVLLLTMSILILGLSDKINSDVLGTLIGGISGYVLNKAMTGLPAPAPSAAARPAAIPPATKK